MSASPPIHRYLIVAFLLAIVLVWGAVAISPALAQCDTPPRSSCISCHGPGGHAEAMGAWNTVHINQDLCTSCHGGNGSSMDRAGAHEGLVTQPLSDIYTSCHSCHPSDYEARSALFAARLNVTPGSCATPTPMAVSGQAGGPPPGGIPLPAGHANAILFWKYPLLIAGALAILAFFLIGLGWLDGHRIEG